MDQQVRQQTTYREQRIGNTIYCITSVYTGEKDLKTALEELTLRRALADSDMKEK